MVMVMVTERVMALGVEMKMGVVDELEGDLLVFYRYVSTLLFLPLIKALRTGRSQVGETQTLDHPSFPSSLVANSGFVVHFSSLLTPRPYHSCFPLKRSKTQAKQMVGPPS